VFIKTGLLGTIYGHNGYIYPVHCRGICGWRRS